MNLDGFSPRPWKKRLPKVETIQRRPSFFLRLNVLWGSGPHFSSMQFWESTKTSWMKSWSSLCRKSRTKQRSTFFPENVIDTVKPRFTFLKIDRFWEVTQWLSDLFSSNFHCDLPHDPTWEKDCGSSTPLRLQTLYMIWWYLGSHWRNQDPGSVVKMTP